ncbi:SDR family oxidoreductase [Blastopirellula marina]|uniref:1-cyclohexenylcarbonyl CoA reductase-short chain family oxidoreductase n=1 Tax=Blastopirellula marina DSM 3645 TaxID=314230 RepID=A3ZWB3_9BACT|nr:SDR family oxidoreductase [Blastopirellula marina]EAQ79141.1 1-cyclohexenylcarbonyl CoA reductase-short chain family oxidoreductase [Blastopirellula marina DSM 3645]
MINLSGRIALVTGSSRGMGRASALRLAEAGCDVIVNYVTSRTAAMETAKEIRAMGRRSFVVKADVSKKDDVESMMEYISEHIQQLDIIVSNAATGGFRPLMAANEKHFENTYHTNVLAMLFLVQAGLPLLEKSKGRAKVIGISSHGSNMALPWYGLIGSSKAALESLARHLTLEVGDKGVNVNIIKSGLVETDSTKRLPGAGEMFDHRKDKTMMGDRMLSIEDIADAVLFLASPLSDLVQGETLVVDGGAAVHV